MFSRVVSREPSIEGKVAASAIQAVIGRMTPRELNFPGSSRRQLYSGLGEDIKQIGRKCKWKTRNALLSGATDCSAVLATYRPTREH